MIIFTTPEERAKAVIRIASKLSALDGFVVCEDFVRRQLLDNTDPRVLDYLRRAIILVKALEDLA